MLSYTPYPTGPIQVSGTIDATLSDGATIVQVPRNFVLNPGDDLTGQPDDLRAMAQALWTPEILAAFQAQVGESQSAD